MNPITRGFRNAFRNGVRTTSIVAILGLSIGLAVTMLVAQKAVENKINNVKSSIGNTISVSPAGFTPGSSTNNALTTSQLSKVASLAHVSSVTETLSDRQSTTGSSNQSFSGPGGNSNSSSTTTSLTSPVTLNSTGGGRFLAGGNSSSSDSTTTATFSLPVTFLGTNTPSTVDGSSISITSGKAIDGTSDTNNVLISEQMASKNSLSVGSTFTAYNATLTIAGIFKTTTQGTENTVVLPLKAMQRLSGQSGVVTNATVNVDSLDNLSSVTTAVKSSLGNSADVTSAEEQADNTVKPLNSVKTVTTYSLIGALAAGAVIILLVMIMIVRERKKEIGVVKAIGGSNLRIMGEFMIESLTLAVLGAVIGLMIGVIGGQPVTKQLVSSSTSSSSTTTTTRDFGGAPGQAPTNGNPSTSRPAGDMGGFGGRLRNNAAVQGLSNVKAQIGPAVIVEGLGVAILIAVIGSGLAAGMISRVRPSTVMRAD